MTTTTSLADNVNDSLELVYRLFPLFLEYEYEIDSKNEELTV